MASHNEKPGAGDAGLGNVRSVLAMERDEITKFFDDVQRVRAAFVLRRVSIQPDLAILIAQLALGEVRS